MWKQVWGCFFYCVKVAPHYKLALFKDERVKPLAYKANIKLNRYYIESVLLGKEWLEFQGNFFINTFFKVMLL